VGRAARRDSNASVRSGAQAKPGVTLGSGALFQNTIVDSAVSGDLVTLLRGGTEAEIRIGSQARPAVVVGCAAGRNGDASVGSRAEAEPGVTLGSGALLKGAIVDGTVGRNLVALFGGSTETETGVGGQARPAIVVGGAARRDSDAAVRSGAQAEAGVTLGGSTGSSNAIVDSAVSRDLVAFFGGGAEFEAGVRGQAGSTVIVGGAARRDGHTGVGSGAEAEPGAAERGSTLLQGTVIDRAIGGFLVALLGGGAEFETGVRG